MEVTKKNWFVKGVNSGNSSKSHIIDINRTKSRLLVEPEYPGCYEKDEKIERYMVSPSNIHTGIGKP